MLGHPLRKINPPPAKVNFEIMAKRVTGHLLNGQEKLESAQDKITQLDDLYDVCYASKKFTTSNANHKTFLGVIL